MALPAVVHAQLTYITNGDNTITITGVIGSPSAVVIPDTTNGLPITSIGSSAFQNCTNLIDVTIGTNVTSIGTYAFHWCYNLTNLTIPNKVTSVGGGAFAWCASLSSVTIPASITYIGYQAFFSCTSLTAITVDTNNQTYRSEEGVLFDKNRTTLIQYPGGRAGDYAVPNVLAIGDSAFDSCIHLASVIIPDSVTHIGSQAFDYCTTLTSVTIPAGVTSIMDITFRWCFALRSVYFKGNAPVSIASTAFLNDTSTVYYLPGTTNWTNPWGGLPTVLWNPDTKYDANFGVKTDQFGFTISGSTNFTVVVEACTNLLNPVWTSVATNTLTGGSSYFNDPQWSNHPARFYRFRSP